MNGYCKNKKINFSAYNAEEKNHIKEYCGDIKMSATFDSGCRGSGQSFSEPEALGHTQGMCVFH